MSTISRVQSAQLCQVNDEECGACCQTFPPSPVDWNPVIASLLYRIAEHAVQSGGVDGLSVDEASQLYESALLALPLVLPGEDDCLDEPKTQTPSRGVTLNDVLQHVPLPSQSGQSRRLRWAVGLSTAPRRQPTLEKTALSMVAAGWDSLHLFVDGPVDLPDYLKTFPRSERVTPSGAWPAWCWALESLLDNNPQAEVLMLVQDDTLFPQISSLREYVEMMLTSDSRPDWLTLYTSAEDMRDSNGWLPYPGVWSYGALAIVLLRETAELLLGDIHRGLLNIEGDAAIDLRLGIWADRTKRPIWFPSPSLVQHIGHVSSIWKRARAVGMRRANRWLMDELLQSSAE